MTSIDDLPLETGRGSEVAVTPSAPSSPGPRVALAVVLLVIGLAAAGWMFFPRTRGTPASERHVVDRAGAQALTEGVPASQPLPPLGELDPVVRTLLSAVSTHPELLKWLATDDLAGSIATAIARLAAGESPSRDLGVLRPSSGFTTTRRDGVTQTDPASYARYRPLAELAATIDAQRLAAAFTTLRPRLVEAYVAQGHDAARFDEAVQKALDVIRTTPDVPVDAALVPAVGGYAYADPAIERLPAAQKHLLRMGPDAVQAARQTAARLAELLRAPASQTR